MRRTIDKLRILTVLLLVLGINYRFIPLIGAESVDYGKLSNMPTDSLFILSESYKNRNQLDSAIGCYILLAGRYDNQMPLAEKYLCAKACKEAGMAYYSKNNYMKALDFLMLGIQHCEENNFMELLPALYNNIGCVYSSLNDFKISISSFEKGLVLSRELNDRKNEKILLTNLACHCSNQNIKDKSELYNRELVEEFGGEDSTVIFYSHLNKGWLYYNDSCYAEAVTCLNRALDYARAAHLAPGHQSVIYETLGVLYMEQPGKRDSAYHYLLTNYRFASENNLLPNLRNTLKQLVECYEEDGEKQKAMAYKLQYWELSDSLLDTNHFSEAKSAHFLYEMEQNYEKIKRLNIEKEEKEEQIRTFRIQLICVLFGLLLFSVLTTITIRQKRKLHKAYVDLFERNAIILRAEQESRKKHLEQTKELEQAQSLIRQLKDNQEQTDADAGEQDGEKETAKGGSSSVISDEQRKQILARLEVVMENTDEVFNCNFSISRLAELTGTNSHYLSQIINETYNKNFRTFINEYRIREAQIRLMNTKKYGNYTIKAIAESVGYKSQSSFIMLFKKATGINPSIYQQLAIQQQQKTN